MAEPKWTPGPWRVDATVATGPMGIYSDNMEVAQELSGVAWFTYARSPVNGMLADRAQVEANAHLIAAAPELYATIESLLEDLAYTTGQATTTECSVGDCCGFFGDGPEPCVHINAQRVLAKARGEV